MLSTIMVNNSWRSIYCYKQTRTWFIKNSK